MSVCSTGGSPCVLSRLFERQVSRRPHETALQTPREASNNANEYSTCNWCPVFGKKYPEFCVRVQYSLAVAQVSFSF